MGTRGAELTEIKSAPAFFDASDIEVTQHFVASDDGTKIPYFVVGHRSSTGPGPTLLGGYGGFEVANTPGYAGVLGRLWLARGGTYVLANIRGGGEYGPTWHTQAMRENRHLVYEDFAAVATDLVDRGITTVEQLGAQGGSNGGLLMGVMLTRYPELFGALVCSVPLLDMRRFHLLLAGASWVAEYGDPDDPDDWAFISEYSPYQNISADRTLSAGADHHVHPRRPGTSGPCPQDDGGAGGGRPSGALLREHRGRPRRRRRQRPDGVQVRADLRVPVVGAQLTN